MRGYRVAGFGLFAVASRQDFVLQSAVGGNDPGFFGILFKKGFTLCEILCAGISLLFYQGVT